MAFKAPERKTADEKLAKSNPINTSIISEIKKEAEKKEVVKKEEQKSTEQPKEAPTKESKSTKTEPKSKKKTADGKSKKIHAAVYLDESDLKFLSLVAKLEGFSTSSYISNILLKELEKKKKELPDLYKISSNS